MGGGAFPEAVQKGRRTGKFSISDKMRLNLISGTTDPDAAEKLVVQHLTHMMNLNTLHGSIF